MEKINTDVRQELQNIAVNTWLESNRKNTLVISTGVGKTKIAIDILKEVKPASVLLLTNSTQLRDINWNDEFTKWGYDSSNVVSECYQTVFRWEGRTFDFVIGDEIDFIADQYIKFFHNNTCKNILGLTGFVTEEKRELINTIAPIIYETNVEDLQESNILNKTEFVFIEYPMSTEKNIERKLKTGGRFYVSENDEYKYWDKVFQQSMIVKTQIEKKYKMLHQSYEDKKDHQAAHWKFISAASKRKKILHKLQSTVQVTKNLIAHIHSKPNNKILIFNTLTEIADLLPNPYHGKSDVEDKGIEKLNLGEINTLSSVKKIVRGTNLVKVNYLIRATFDGSEVDFFQSHGRLMRLAIDKIATYIILIPLYEDLVKIENGTFKKMLLYTQAEKWKQKMLTSFDLKNPKIIRLNKDYQVSL